jgi:ribosomal protein S18 acetylase RimI-like enzyme
MSDLHVTDDVERFAAAAEGYLMSDPVAHTVALTVLARLRSGHQYGAAPQFGWLTDDAGEVVATACWTPPFHVSLGTAEPSYAASLAPAFAEADGVVGRVDAAHAFAAALSRPAAVQMSELLYELDQLVPPPAPPGTPRPIAGEADLDLAMPWWEAFLVEAGAPGRDHRGAIEYRMNNGGAVWFWERDGEPVCLAGRHPTVAGVTRIGPVYTPPEHRRQGYGAALTAAVTADALTAGVTGATLFADAANPTSNGVYRRIGFREVATLVDLRFEPPPAGSGSGR